MNGVCLLLAEVNPTWMFLAGVALLTSVMLRLAFRRGRQQRSSPASTTHVPRRAPAASTGSRDLLRQIEEKQVEFEERSREVLARLDNKIAVLQRLLTEGEAAVARLQEYGDKGQQSGDRSQGTGDRGQRAGDW